MHAVFKGRHAHLLHEAMIPFYEKYIHLDSEIFDHSHISLELEISDLMKIDPYIGQWFENYDLLDVVGNWWVEETESQYNIIFHLMKCVLNGGYDNDWEKLADDFRFRLLSEVECGTPWSREVYAIMNGICMIWKSSADESEKMQLLDKMKGYWDFLKYLYSVMFRQLIGCNYRNFAQVANMIHFRSAYHPYAHLFYAVFVERADALQSSLKMGGFVMDRKHPDFLKTRVLTTLFGGYFGSRLMSNIREDKGYTYGIGAGIVNYPGIGILAISTEADNRYVDSIITEVYKEMEILQNDLVSDEELNMVKNYMLGDWCRSYEGPFSLPEAWIYVQTAGLDDDFFNRSLDAIQQVTPEEIRLLAQRYFCKENLIEVVSGKKV
jgi:hypothetical protein